MYLSLFILCASLSIFSCEAATLDYSNITPWSIVYAVYPIYDTQPWVEIWPNERSLNTPHTVTVGSNGKKRNDVDVRKETSNNHDSGQESHSNNRKNQNQHLNSNQKAQSQSHLWSLHYKNWPQISDKQEHK